MPGSWVDHFVWRAYDAAIPFNADAAIYRFWRAQRAQGNYLGSPTAPEQQTPVGVQQPFTSGAVIGWSAELGAHLAHDE